MASDAAPILDAAGDADTNQPLAGRTPRFAAYFKVRHYEMDAYGHVNNAVYLHYLEQAAIEHSAASGFPDERARELGGAWVVRRHEIEYLRPAAAGDVLQVVTWAVEFKGARAYRDYAIFRVDAEASGHERRTRRSSSSHQIRFRPVSRWCARARSGFGRIARLAARAASRPRCIPAFLGAATRRRAPGRRRNPAQICLRYTTIRAICGNRKSRKNCVLCQRDVDAAHRAVQGDGSSDGWTILRG